MALAIFFSPFPDSLIWAKNRFVKNGMANFGQKIATEISGPPPEVILNFPVGRLSIGIPTKISGIFGKVESTQL